MYVRSGLKALCILISAINCGEWSTSHPEDIITSKVKNNGNISLRLVTIYAMKRYSGVVSLSLWGRAPGTHCIGGLVGPRAGLDEVQDRKICCPCRELNPGRPDCSP
jgi:hypothetical protein